MPWYSKGENMKNVKYSIIIPAYNAENYLENCLDSVVSQTYKNFEVIIINDGSTDNTQKIIDKYLKKYKFISCIIQKTSGLSASRNNGLDKAIGKYIVYLDSDDSINTIFLSEVDKVIQEETDLVRVNVNTIDNNKEVLAFNSESFKLTGEELFMYLLDNKVMIVPAWAYVYKRKFLLKNNFKYELGRYHEDYGLTIKILLTSNRCAVVPTAIYNYYIRSNSIMTSKNGEKNNKKATDMLYFYDNMILFLNNNLKNKEKCIKAKSYMTNGLLNNLNNLEKKYKNDFIIELKKRKIENNLLSDTIGRKLKKLICCVSYKLYAMLFNK